MIKNNYDQAVQTSENELIKLQKQQRITRITGLLMSIIGLITYPLSIISGLILFTVPFAICLVMGITLFVRSFVHKKYNVLKCVGSTNANRIRCEKDINNIISNRENICVTVQDDDRKNKQETNGNMEKPVISSNEREYINPPEIMKLYDYFTWTEPSYLYETDGDEDWTGINWLQVKGNSVEQSVNEYVAFKPQIEKYNMDVLGMDSWMLLRHMKKDHTNFTYFIADSSNQIPSDQVAFDRLKEICLNNSIRIVKQIGIGKYFEYIENKYYRLEVDEEWPGSVDDAATYGAYHIYEVTENGLKIDDLGDKT